MKIQPLGDHSRFAQRVRRRYGQYLALLPAGLPTEQGFQQVFDQLCSQGQDSATALRVTRQLVIERLLVADCEQAASIDSIIACMSLLAQWALNLAFQISQKELQTQFGVPLDSQGGPAQLLIVGMGKLGARELNVSSDVDLIYVYDQDGQTEGNGNGLRRISNLEFFAKQVRAISDLIGKNTEHGFVFRVDLALRPNGNSGLPAISLAALQEYFAVQGREWERFAWLKSRVVAPPTANPVALQLKSIVMPFVFRRYLDYNVFDSLRLLHRQIREHAQAQNLGRSERGQDIKLGRGGIREIEFIVQLLQVVRGGQFPELRSRPTQSALLRLQAAGLMSALAADKLTLAYQFLRQIEHRIQYLDDAQTHLLPTAPEDLHWVALTMGFSGTAEFQAALATHCDIVANEFDTLLGGGQSQPESEHATRHQASQVHTLDSLLGKSDGKLQLRLQLWRDNPRIQSLRDDSRNRLHRLIERTMRWLSEGKCSLDATIGFIDWIEPLLRREGYLALMLERPIVHQRLLHILGASRWAIRYLMQHPGVIDELADESMLTERFDAVAFENEVQQRQLTLAAHSEDDDETLLNLLRRAHHAEILRTLARDVEKHILVEDVGDDLSALADCLLKITSRWCWQRLKKRHCNEPRMGIIAYGKLGSKELGYGSDLDLVFVYQDDDEQAGSVYVAWLRKLINWANTKTSEGNLYEIDTELRPNGNSGLLISHMDAYANYQLQRGSNSAWTWEHQAMTRARWVLGPEDLRLKFEATREAVLCTPRDQDELRKEIMAMRQKMRKTQPAAHATFCPKHSPGGMVDIEFAVQYLQLSQSHAHPELRANVGTRALLLRAEECGLLPAGVGTQAAHTYRQMRQLQHWAYLNEASPESHHDSARFSATLPAGAALWKAVFD